MFFEQKQPHVSKCKVTGTSLRRLQRKVHALRKKINERNKKQKAGSVTGG